MLTARFYKYEDSRFFDKLVPPTLMTVNDVGGWLVGECAADGLTAACQVTDTIELQADREGYKGYFRQEMKTSPQSLQRSPEFLAALADLSLKMKQISVKLEGQTAKTRQRIDWLKAMPQKQEPEILVLHLED